MSQHPASTPARIPPIWVLNLARSPERRERIARHLDGMELQYEFIEAIDGWTMSPEECAQAVDAKKVARLLGRQLLPAEVACALSHRKAYQRQVDEGLEEVIIFEDDAKPDPGFRELLALKDQFPAKSDLLYFYRSRTRESIWGRRFVGRWLFVKFGSMAFGAVAYLVRLSAARKLLAHSYPIEAPADWLTGGAVRTGVRLWGLYPSCVHEFSTDLEASTMPEARMIHVKTPEQLKRHWLAFHLERYYYRVLFLNQRYNPFCIM